MIDPHCLTRAVEAASEGVVIADAQAEDIPVIYVNPAFKRITGYEIQDVYGRNCRFLQGTDTVQRNLDVLRESLKTGRPCSVVLRNYRKDGTLFWNELSISLVHSETGQLTHFIGIQKDVTERVIVRRRLRRYEKRLKRANRRLKHLAGHDPLTQLYNRRRFRRIMMRDWRVSIRDRSPVTVLMFDIDHFKEYNDTYGHPAGDEALRRVGEALKDTLRRASDVVARYGGEEFIALLRGQNEEEARSLSETVLDRIRELAIPATDAGPATVLTVSAGVAHTVPSPGSSPEDLIRRADRCLYEAKFAGRNRVVYENGKDVH